MTPTEKLLAEQEKVVAERGYYIRPIRMANLMKAAAKIFDVLTRTIRRSATKNAVSFWRSWEEPSTPPRRERGDALNRAAAQGIGRHKKAPRPMLTQRTGQRNRKTKKFLRTV